MALASSEALALSQSSHLPELLVSTERSLVWWVASCLAGPLIRPSMAAMLWFTVDFGVIFRCDECDGSVWSRGVVGWNVFQFVLELSGKSESEEGAVENMGLALTPVTRSSCLHNPLSMPQYSTTDSYLRGM
jgi:hypothetical protein